MAVAFNLSMAATLTRRLRDGVLGISGIGMLVTGMAAIDDTFRVQLASVLSGDFVAMLPSLPDLRAGYFTRIVQNTMLSLGLDASVVVFAAIGLVLFLFMFRL